MADEIVLDSPVDVHVHFRQGDMLRQVVPLTARTWAAAMAMPNTDPPVRTGEEADNYRRVILDAAGGGFEAYTTLYFQDTYTRSFLEGVKPHVLAVKFYPKGLTTNSEYGCDPNDPGVHDVLGHLEELGIPLCVHPESPGYHEDREYLFRSYVAFWAGRFPELKIVLEHLSDRRSLELLAFPNVYGTVTPQHLLMTGDDLMGPPLKPHNYCLPVLKRPQDRNALVSALFSPFGSKLMAGTDSAPHTRSRKLLSGCAGCFTAPIALQLYAEVFADWGKLDLLQDFVSGNAQRIYGIRPPAKRVRLVRQPFTVPDRYGDIVSLRAGETLEWSVSKNPQP